VVKKPFEAVRGDVRYQLRNEAKSAELKRLQETVKVKQYE
jgi:peptidyl-prolyl cis-trans isomerase C